MDGRTPPTYRTGAGLFPRSKSTTTLCVCCALVLAGCATYTPALQHPDSFPGAYSARTLGPAPANGTWTSADLLAAALAHNPAVAAALERRRAALAAVRGVRLPGAPTLTLTAEYANAHPHWGYGAAGDFPLRLGAVRRSQITLAELAALQALYDHAEAVWTVRAALTQAQADLAASADLLAGAQRLEALRQQRLARIERRIALGEDDRTLGLTARAELATSRARVRAAQAQQTQARLALAAALSVPLEALAGLAIASVTPPAEALADGRRDAITGRADVLRAIADYDLAEAGLRSQVARQYPEVRLGPGYMYDHGVSKLPFNLSLALPPLDGNRSGIAQAEATRAASGRALEAVQAGVLTRIDAAGAALVSARTTEAQVRSGELSAARALAERTARAVAAGASDRVEDLGARALLAEAELNLVAAQNATRQAAADLEDALRRPFDPAEAAVLARVLSAAGAVK